MLLGGFIGRAYADNVPVDSVRVVATNAFSYFSGISPSETVIRDITPITKNDTVVMYICNFEKGFIIVSADNTAYPVLGFSDEGIFSLNDAPPAVELITNGYKEEILHAKRTRTTASEEIRSEWWKYLRNTVDRSFYAPTHYLIQTKWAQTGGYLNSSILGYNYYCPKHATQYGDSCKTLLGCGAVALAQILHYWACDVYPHGTVYNSHEGININLSNQSYEWYHMLSRKANIHNARLLADCAIAINSKFGCIDSGTSSRINTVASVLNNNWGFTSAHVESKGDEQVWIAKLKSNLSQRYPIYYRGENNNPNDKKAHAWVIDGYNNDNYFHCNFGWGGSNDGWYLLSAITPGSNNFNYIQLAILYFYPTSYTNTEFINTTIYSGTYSGHKVTIENSSVNSNSTVVIDTDCSTEIFGPFSVPLGSSLNIQ